MSYPDEYKHEEFREILHAVTVVLFMVVTLTGIALAAVLTVLKSI
jgi:cytochrome b subunit of formate dehydrogenase